MSAVPDPRHQPDHTRTAPRHAGESRNPIDAAWLLAQYDRIADAPDAVARLRRFVLNLAVRGKLVAQSPKDTPASELLQRIDDERQRHGLKSIPRSIDPDEAPFVLPNQWEWSRIGDICTKTGSGSTPRGGKSAYKIDGVPFLRSQNVHNDGLRIDNVALIDPEVHDRMSGTKVRPNDLLLNITGGSIGRCCHVPHSLREANISQHVAILRSAVPEMAVFLHWFVLSPYFQLHVLDRQTGAGRGGLPKNRMDKIVIALPPLAEQHRIVAKVDELMALCDRLEAARTRRAVTRDRLATASLRRLTAPDTDAATFRDHARFALDHLPALTTCPDQIKALRQTILDLAVRGKLVEQNADDAAAKLPPKWHLEADETFPDKWQHVPLEAILAENTRNGYSRRPDNAKNGFPILRISAGTARQDGFVAEEQYKLISNINKKTKDKYQLMSGDLLACRFNGNKEFVGRLSLFTDNLGLNPLYPDKLIRVRLNKHIAEPKFIRLAGESDVVRRHVEEFCATTVGNWGISATNLKRVAFPIPPLAEQHRIVAEVDQLMALCDQLEASLAKTETTRSRLLESALYEALQPHVR